ncbi:MAG: NADPH-dependent glutamate synthase [Promethearchaeota archaeon]|nr:MAG: NADPH-dependent glutamate synthase [Candidatus Lokiarchaeota archaeon]
MEFQTPLVKVLIENEDKILSSKKFSKQEFEIFIKDLTVAENQRYLILEKIREKGDYDLDVLQKTLNVSKRELILNIEFLKELGLLKFINMESAFYENLENKNDIKGLFPNISEIQEKKICSGCGLCVSVCPVNAIKFKDDILTIDLDLCINCGLCYACCHRTFFPKELEINEACNEIDAKFQEEFNGFKEIHTAQTRDSEIKRVAQDGGIVTSLLKAAFNEKVIKNALVVGEFKDGFSLKPLPLLVKNEVELLRSSGTKYSNAHILQLLHEARGVEDLAIVGTPCTMQALKKISFYPLNKPYYNNIKLKIGLFCMESFDYQKIIEILKEEFNKIPEEIKKMDINNGHFFVYDKNYKSYSIPIKNIKKYGRYGCFLCSDLTTEHCDISVGSIGSNPGWSTMIIRTEIGQNLFQKSTSRNLIFTKKIKEDEKNFSLLSRIALSKIKRYKEIPRQKMIEQDPNIRIQNFEEVPQGLTEKMVILETQRCLQCGNPLCIQGCPVNVDIPQFIKLLRSKKYKEASMFIKQYNLLPAICGRVCPQETQCEGVCLLGNVDKPVAIGYLERFIADWERKSEMKECPECQAPKNIKVAIIGSGPAGLTCAGELTRIGYDVTVFEALHTGGGVLVYGIPEFRLPKIIVEEEIESLKDLGVKVKYNMIIGKILSIEDLKEKGYKAIFIGVGAGLPVFLNIPGLRLNGVTSANEFLTRANLMKAYKFPEYDTPIRVGKIVTVIGGGNVAMDSARVALRLGAKKVIIVYRRSEQEMPARREEYHHGKEEGLEFQFLTNPIEFLGDQDENVKQMVCQKMELGDPDDSGRRSPIPIKGSEFIIDTDMIIIAIGTRANPICPKSIPNLNLNKWGYIETNDKCQTNLEEIFAGGDIVTGSATVISAMGAGKRAAEGIHEYLTKKYKISVDHLEKIVDLTH